MNKHAKELSMKHLNAAICVALFAAGAIVTVPATAADVLIMGESPAVSAVSGGMNEEDRQTIEKRFPQHKLQLLFASKGTPNEFLADIKVQIKDGSGKTVLDTVSEGPFLQVKMPVGKYSISAGSEGVFKTQSIQVSAAGPQRVVFIW
jgi:hypothetical protein